MPRGFQVGDRIHLKRDCINILGFPAGLFRSRKSRDTTPWTLTLVSNLEIAIYVLKLACGGLNSMHKTVYEVGTSSKVR